MGLRVRCRGVWSLVCKWECAKGTARLAACGRQIAGVGSDCLPGSCARIKRGGFSVGFSAERWGFRELGVLVLGNEAGEAHLEHLWLWNMYRGLDQPNKWMNIWVRLELSVFCLPFCAYFLPMFVKSKSTPPKKEVGSTSWVTCLPRC